MSLSIAIIGAGLAGSEAAWQVAKSGYPVTLIESRPIYRSPAHLTDACAELVCSNSLKSEQPTHAAFLLKEEMAHFDSLILKAASVSRVPAGKALAVDRDLFARTVTQYIEAEPKITLVRGEVVKIGVENDGSFTLTLRNQNVLPAARIVIATGPLTAPDLAASLQALFGEEYLYFYDSIAPVVEADSIDMELAYRGSRYDVGSTPEGDYINCPLSRDTYYRLVEELLRSEKIPIKDFDRLHCFEGCQPIEVMAETGPDTLRHGPLKPMGLRDPRTGETPYAVCQLRQDNRHGSLYNMVGFQTRMKYPEQDRVLRLIPALRGVAFARYGSMHRNTYINGPLILDSRLMIRNIPNFFLAGQLTGVEGYVESAATGLYVGIAMTGGVEAPPPTTAIGALIRHITAGESRAYQPMNVIWGIFPPPPTGLRKPERIAYWRETAQRDFRGWVENLPRPLDRPKLAVDQTAQFA